MNHVINIPRLEVEGRYRMVTTSAKTGKVRDVLDFPNLITDKGLESIFTNNGFGPGDARFAVGTGTTPPAVTDTGLEAPLARATSSSSAQDTNSGSSVANPWVQRRFNVRFSEGAAAGNLTEIGFGGFSGVTAPQINALSRALILDSAGNPTTLTVLPDEFLDVYYYLRLYIPLTDTTGSFTDSASNVYNFVMRPASSLANWSVASLFSGVWPNPGAPASNQSRGGGAVLGNIFNTPSGGVVRGNDGPQSVAKVPYVPGNFYGDFSATWNVSAISGDVDTLTINTSGTSGMFFQMSFNPPLPMDYTKTMTLSFRFSAGRYTGPL